MNQNSVGWFEIYVDDMDRAKAFYETVFQITLDTMAMPEGSEGMTMVSFPMVDMTAPGAPGALVKMSEYGPSATGTIVYFNCDDCGVEISRVEAAGGSVIKAKESIGEYGYMALFTDTEGNTIGLHSVK